MQEDSELDVNCRCVTDEQLVITPLLVSVVVLRSSADAALLEGGCVNHGEHRDGADFAGRSCPSQRAPARKQYAPVRPDSVSWQDDKTVMHVLATMPEVKLSLLQLLISAGARLTIRDVVGGLCEERGSAQFADGSNAVGLSSCFRSWR